MVKCGKNWIEPLERRLNRSADFGFAVTAGAGGSDRGNSLDIDPSGNSIVAGVFNGTVDFDSSAATANLTAGAADAAFVAKYSKAGALAWARGFGGTGEQNIQAVATDGSGNVYIAGYFSGTLDADPGSGVSNITAKGQRDGLLIKLTPAGTFAWARTLGGSSEEGCTALDVDASGNVFALGMFKGSGDYDPSAGTKTLTSHGDYDVFLTALTSAGTFRYAVSVGGSGEDFGNGVSVNRGGQAVLAGTFRGSIDLDPGSAVRTATSAGSRDVFVIGLDGNGAYRFGSTLGGRGDDQAGDVHIDSGGNTIVVGQFTGTADFDPSTASARLTSAGSTDAFVAKLNANGGYSWARRIGGSAADRATNLTTDGSNNAYVTGQLSGHSIFATKFSSAGSAAWSRTTGSKSGDLAEAIGVDNAGGIYLIGTFVSSVDFDPSATTQTRTSHGGSDWFLWKLIGG